MLSVVTYLWGDKYGADDVRKLAAGLARHMKEPYRLLVMVDRKRAELSNVLCLQFKIPDPELLKVKGCFARLRLFDPQFIHDCGIAENERVVCIDLDVVVTGDLYPLFYRPEPFLILQGANAANPCPYNGSLWMLRAGYRPDVWRDFSLDAAKQAPFYEFPDDQGWFWHKMPNASGWQVGSPSGIYAFQKPGWGPKGDDLPKDARLVVFPGWRSPEKFKHLPWVKEKWV